MITLIYSSFLKKSLFTFKHFLLSILKKNQITYVLQPVITSHKYITLLKSPHINKRAKENFQSTLYKFIFLFERFNSESLRGNIYLIFLMDHESRG